MGEHVQVVRLGLAQAMVEGDAEGLGGLGCVLGDVAGDLLLGQLPATVGADVAHIQLLTPAGNQGHALVLVNNGAGHGHGGSSPADGPLE